MKEKFKLIINKRFEEIQKKKEEERRFREKIKSILIKRGLYGYKDD